MRCFRYLARHAASVILFAALFCTLLVKFYHASRQHYLASYPGWVLSDIAVILTVELLLAILCYRWPKRWVIRTAIISSAVICAWSVMNAGWLVRTGTQILPTVLLPLIRDPLNALGIIGVNLAKMPLAAIAILGPSAVALTFFFIVVAKPLLPNCTPKPLFVKLLLSAVIILSTLIARPVLAAKDSSRLASEEMSYNCQLRAIAGIIELGSAAPDATPLSQPLRQIPSCDDLLLRTTDPNRLLSHNLVIVVLEGVQYRYTSLADEQNDLTPHLVKLARQGVEFSNARSTLTHTTKVLFSLLTGRFPSVSQDLAEAVPVEKPYGSLATILSRQSGFRTAFFQSAKGTFESRPALIHNLGFDTFHAREDLQDTNAFVGSLGSDEFSMLKPLTNWIKENESPFFITVLCSVTHDPYEVPSSFAEPAKTPEDRCKQAIAYTDQFLVALDDELTNLGLIDNTILCVIGDHGEAFGEHGFLGHERIAFDEALRIPFCIRAPSLIQPGARITAPVGSVDLTPTILAMMGFNVSTAGFDGLNALALLPSDRKVFFSGWLSESPAGFIKGSQKYIYYPQAETVWLYDLQNDPLELAGSQLNESDAAAPAEEILAWRAKSIFSLVQQDSGEKTLFKYWLCRWEQRVAKKCSRL
jgi:arylsulfatase A-like enzyme